MNETTRDEVRQVLLSWQAGHLSPREVHEWADDRYPTHGTVEDDLVVAILARLDMLDMNLMTPDDIPVLLNALGMPEGRIDEAFDLLEQPTPGSPAPWPRCEGRIDEAFDLLEQHDATVDIASRKRTLGNDPFYGRYCT